MSATDASSFAPLLAAVAPVFVMLAIGWILRRTGSLRPEADSSILRLGVNVFYPALIADTIIGNAALQDLRHVVLPAALGAATTALGFGVAMLSAKLFRLPNLKQARTFAFTAGLQNYGFIAIPLIDVLFGRATLGVQFTFTLGVEVMLWSVGVWLLSSGRGATNLDAAADARSGAVARPLPVWRAMLTAPVIAILISIAVNFLLGGGWLPVFGRTALKWLGGCSFPTQIILTGAVLADVIRTAQPGHWLRPVVLGSIVRQGILPVLILLLLARIGHSMELRHVLVVQAAMPSAMIPVILVKHYEGDTDLAAWLVTISTALGLVTIPLWMRAGLWWVGG